MYVGKNSSQLANVSESQNLKRESKSLILSLELTQRADFAPRAYTEESRLKLVKNLFLTSAQRPGRQTAVRGVASYASPMQAKADGDGAVDLVH